LLTGVLTLRSVIESVGGCLLVTSTSRFLTKDAGHRQANRICYVGFPLSHLQKRVCLIEMQFDTPRNLNPAPVGSGNRSIVCSIFLVFD
jgi:hypothetical protein